MYSVANKINEVQSVVFNSSIESYTSAIKEDFLYNFYHTR